MKVTFASSKVYLVYKLEKVDKHEEEGEDAKARALALVPVTCRLSDCWLFRYRIQLFLN